MDIRWALWCDTDDFILIQTFSHRTVLGNRIAHPSLLPVLGRRGVFSMRAEKGIRYPDHCAPVCAGSLSGGIVPARDTHRRTLPVCWVWKNPHIIAVKRAAQGWIVSKSFVRLHRLLILISWSLSVWAVRKLENQFRPCLRPPKPIGFDRFSLCSTSAIKSEPAQFKLCGFALDRDK